MSVPHLQAVDAFRESGNHLGQLPDESRQPHDTGAVRFGKAVWGGKRHQGHVIQCQPTSTTTPLDSVNSELLHRTVWLRSVNSTRS